MTHTFNFLTTSFTTMNPEDRHHLNLEEKKRGVRTWLQKSSPRNVSPHYHTDDNLNPEVALVATPALLWCPRAFKNKLQVCVCSSTSGDPAKVLQCLKSHTKTFCWFCFDILPNTSKAIYAHNKAKGHFFNESEKTVLCPFAQCPEEVDCLNKPFYYMKAIRSHIISQHLPNLEEIIKTTENFGDNMRPTKYKYCNSSSSESIESGTSMD